MSRVFWSTMTSSADTNDAHRSQELRSRILKIAERLFREVGYRKTTVADIAADLGMSPGNVYRFFPSKRALNEAVADRMLSEIEAELLRLVERPSVPAATRLREFVTTMHQMSEGRFTANRRIHEMVEVALAESWDVVHRHINSVDRMICQLVEEGVASGEFRSKKPLIAARCVHSAILRFCHPTLIAQCGEEVGPTIDEMIEFLLNGLVYH